MASNVELGRESFLDSQSSIPTRDRISIESGPEYYSAANPKDAPVEAILSVTQEHLWGLEQFASGKPINNIAIVLEITGDLDLVALQRAVAQYVHQRAELRTVVENREGRPVARLRSATEGNIPVTDLTEFPEPAREPAAMRIAEAAAHRFDVATGPLLRFQALRLGVEIHWLVVTAHRIILDESSMATLCWDLARAYSATVQGHAASVGRPVAHPEKEYSEAEDFEYWTRKLAGRIPALDLPTDHPRPPRQTYNGAIVPLGLSGGMLTKLEDFARREAVGLQSVLLAAYAAVLHRYSGYEDIVIGTRREGEGRTNVLAIRNNVSGHMPFRDLVQRVWQTALEAEAHRRVPFERVIETLRLERDPSRSPLFQVTLDLRATRDDVLNFGSARACVRELHTGTTKYDLSLSLSRTADGLTGFIEFNSDLFEATTIERFRGHFETLLGGAIDEPSQIVGRLPLLTAAEREQILVSWNRTERPYSQDKCVHHLFEEQVERTPERIVAVFEEQELTYRQLNDRANAIAARLRALDAGPDARVGICVGRSVEMLAGLLGILKAGAAYVPLDPTYPRERLAFMVEDAHVHALLTTRELAGGFEGAATNLLCIADISAVEGTQPAASKVTPDDLAYVIYTSGSTGKPKGVMIRHRNVVNFFTGMDDVLGTGSGTWLAVTSICFDIHVLELLWTVARGFKVVIQSDEAGMRAAAANSGSPLNRAATIKGYTIPEQITRHQVTHFQCTPSLMGMLLQEPGARGALAKLDTVLLGGEALTPALLGQLSGPRRIVNVYGPTETTVWSTSDIVDPDGPITVGRPLANTTIYILDRFGEPTPVGVPGELFIGGAGVVRGYHNRPELTAERFISNPFAPANGERMYRTGDLARYRADGKIDFLGRMDHQVKLRGFRIELGEIETALRQVPGVRDAVVVVRELNATDKRLAAYLVAERNIESSVMRGALKERLPDYMVPSLYTFLPSLPLTPNGKVDRKALPEPDGLRTEVVAPFTAPRTEMERRLAGFWRDLLGVEVVGINDNFFDLGGRSMLLLQAQARIAATWRKEIAIIDLLQHPTIAGFARLIGDNGEEETEGGVENQVLDAAERRKLLVDWNRTELEYPREACIHELFEAQAERTPDAVAAIFAGEEISYRELNRRANQLAHHLRSLGVGRDVLVGLCVERSFALLVGALGIFKAGGAYVPLDWTYPAERVRFMLEDTEAPVVVTQNTLLQHVPASAARLVCLDSDWERIAERSTANPERIGDSGDMAYVMYTSGSTGVSKGVALEHRNAVSFIHWAREVFSSDELAGVLASTSICFDLSIFELFVPLSWGGAVVLADNAVNLPTLPAGRSITLINTVPSAIKDLLKKSAIPSTVTVVNLAGEKLRTQVVNQLYALPHIRKVYDLYGPSEATTYATWTLRTMDGPATVGRPVANTQIYILDAHMQPCPVGATGEIYIGGDCLARGYINRPQLTAERFISNPFVPGARLYKTGDLGRYFADGNIDFLGRKDQQVKIRGFRIELGEIEAVLAEHSQVQECVAAVRDDGGDEKQLVAFIVPRPNSRITSAEVRRFLRERLPDYMVPTAYMTLPALPLTANGKVDRKALPAPTAAMSLPEEGRETGPLTPVQEAVSEIWRNVLGIENVGLQDDFFDLGGHSVLVTQITSRVRQVFDVELSMRHLFGAPTVAGLAQIIEERLEEQLREMSQEELQHLAAGRTQEVA